MKRIVKGGTAKKQAVQAGNFWKKLLLFMLLMIFIIAGGYYMISVRSGDNDVSTNNVRANSKSALSVENDTKAELEKMKKQIPSNMVHVEGGTFNMGSPESDEDSLDLERPVHSVTVDSFYIGKYEVTQREWAEVMGSNPSHFKGDNLPVERVSWYDAVEFCNKKSKKEGLTPCYTISGTNVTCNWNANGYRLPTEAEWEYACRAGTTTAFHYGNSLDSTMANFDGNYPYGGASKGVYRQKTTPVGQFKPNALGLYDMHGNVWEWCWDWYGNYSNNADKNPVGPDSGSPRVLRGGCWYNFAQNCRSADRGGDSPDYRNYHAGLRLARVP